MARPKEQLSCRALALSEPVLLTAAPESTEALVKALIASRSPLGTRIQKASDSDPIVSAAAELRSLGFCTDEDLAILDLVLRTPAIAMRNKDHQHLLLAQSIISSQGPIRAVCRARVEPGHPPVIAVLDLEIDPIEPEQDVTDLVLDVAEWHTEYTSPEAAPRTGSEAWAFIGNPEAWRLKGAPRDWTKRIDAIAKVLGTRPVVTKDGFAALRLNYDRYAKKFTLPGVCTPAESERLGFPIVLGDHASTYQQVERLLVTQLVEWVTTTSERSKVKLYPGDVHYHRKVNCGGGRDYFGKPLSGPCGHGADGFRRFHGAPMAEKGMAALYANFDPSMLHHCSHYPNCNVYAVKMPSRQTG